MTDERVEIGVIGGGPAGAVLGARLRAMGHDVAILERAPAWRWRAGGVFASPATVTALARVGLDAETMRTVARPIPAMRVETAAGTVFRLTYGADTGGEPAVGFDRSRLDPALLELARRAGADVRLGWSVAAVDPVERRLHVRRPDGTTATIRAEVIVGADGRRSMLATAAGVDRPSRLGPRVGLTYHLPDPDPSTSRDARMRILRDGYVGIAPVAGGLVNVGIVLGESWQAELAARGGRVVADSIVAAIPATDGDPATWRTGHPTDAVVGAVPLGRRVTRRAGRGWLLVGDAAGFIDPFTGEGLHRSLVSSELAAAAIHAQSRGIGRAFAAYDREMQRRFLAKDAVSAIVQLFLGRPALFEYAARRLASRPALRATMGLAMGDLIGASRILDPRYLSALLAP